METPNFIVSYQTEQYDFCDQVIDRFEQLLNNEFMAMTPQQRKQNGFMVGADTNGGNMNRTDLGIDFKSVDDPLLSTMNDILNIYVREYSNKHMGFASQPCISERMKVQKTQPKGGFHSWHCEQNVNQNASFRNLTWTLYLNDIPKGEGETEFLEYGVKVQPKKGLLCFFPAAWTHIHRGNPVYSCDKYIATGWYYLT